MLKQGGFNLRKFSTNSNNLQRRIDEQDCGAAEETYSKFTLGPVQCLHPGEQKVLGMRWDTTSDHIVYDLSDLALLSNELEPTKRQVIGIVGRFFDPIGYLAPVVVRFKVFFQELCRSKVGWDEPLIRELLDKWQSAVYKKTTESQLLDVISAVLIKRCRLIIYVDSVMHHSVHISLHEGAVI